MQPFHKHNFRERGRCGPIPGEGSPRNHNLLHEKGFNSVRTKEKGDGTKNDSEPSEKAGYTGHSSLLHESRAISLGLRSSDVKVVCACGQMRIFKPAEINQCFGLLQRSHKQMCSEKYY